MGSDDDEDRDGAGPSRRRRPHDGGSGRETEDEMRKRILDELEVERKGLEMELKELKAKTEDARVAGAYLTS